MRQIRHWPRSDRSGTDAVFIGQAFVGFDGVVILTTPVRRMLIRSMFLFLPVIPLAPEIADLIGVKVAAGMPLKPRRIAHKARSEIRPTPVAPGARGMRWLDCSGCSSRLLFSGVSGLGEPPLQPPQPALRPVPATATHPRTAFLAVRPR